MGEPERPVIPDNDFVLLHDADFKLVGVSKAAAALLGYTVEELLGKDAWEPGLIVSSPERAAQIRAALERGEDVHEVATVISGAGKRLRIPYTTQRVDRSWGLGSGYVTIAELPKRPRREQIERTWAEARERREEATRGEREDPWMTRKEAAAYARVSINTLDRARGRGELHSSKTSVNGHVRMRKSWVDAWLSLYLSTFWLILAALMMIVLVGLILGLACGGCGSITHFARVHLGLVVHRHALRGS